MWHLFDRYKGVVWPKARQLNLIAKILNNLCQGTGIKLDTPTVPSPASPVTIAVDTEWLDEYIAEDGGAGVTSVNEKDGALTVNGGKDIRVDTVGNAITISYEEGKDPDDEEPSCNNWTVGEGGFENDWSSGFGNKWSGDDCSELNGW